MARRPYPTEPTDTEWRLIEPHIPPAEAGGRPPLHARRELVIAIY
jgi:transposase